MADQEIQSQIDQAVKSNKIFVFMKGTPDQPMCGFSAATVQVLKRLNVPFAAANVLEDERIREGVKQYSNWPTIPQVFVNGEFVGGNDIIQQMYASGELQKMVQG